MGVYINMEMPISCAVCFNRGCGLWREVALPAHQRHKYCPLIPVPPHGRLIDADALMARFEKEEKAADEHGRDFSFSFKSAGENCAEWWSVQQMLFYAPTIIPADPAEEGET